MSDIPLSIMAWIGVVLIQAVVHYVVFGAQRRHRRHYQQRTADVGVAEDAVAITESEEVLEVTAVGSAARYDDDDLDRINLGRRQQQHEDENGDGDCQASDVEDIYETRSPVDGANESGCECVTDVHGDGHTLTAAGAIKSRLSKRQQPTSRSRSTTPAGRRRMSSCSSTQLSSPLSPSPATTPSSCHDVSGDDIYDDDVQADVCRTGEGNIYYHSQYRTPNRIYRQRHDRRESSWASISPTFDRTVLKIGCDVDIIDSSLISMPISVINNLSSLEDDEELSPFELSQTGSEILKVRMMRYGGGECVFPVQVDKVSADVKSHTISTFHFSSFFFRHYY